MDPPPFFPTLTPISSTNCTILSTSTQFCPSFTNTLVASFEDVDDLDEFLSERVFVNAGLKEFVLDRELRCEDPESDVEEEDDTDEPPPPPSGIQGWVSYICAQLGSVSKQVCESETDDQVNDPLCLESCVGLANSLLEIPSTPDICPNEIDFQARAAIDALFRECASNPDLNSLSSQCVDFQSNETLLCESATREEACELECEETESEGLCQFEDDEIEEPPEPPPADDGSSSEETADGSRSDDLDAREIAIIVGSSVAALIVIAILAYLVYMCYTNRKHMKETVSRSSSKTWSDSGVLFAGAAGAAGMGGRRQGKGGNRGSRGSRDLVAVGVAEMQGQGNVRPPTNHNTPPTITRQPYISPTLSSPEAQLSNSSNPISPVRVPPVLMAAQRSMIGVVDDNEMFDPRRQQPRVVSVASQTDYNSGGLSELYDMVGEPTTTPLGGSGGHGSELLSPSSTHPSTLSLPQHSAPKVPEAPVIVTAATGQPAQSQPSKHDSQSTGYPIPVPPIPPASNNPNRISSLSRNSSRNSRYSHASRKSQTPSSTISTIPSDVRERLKPLINVSLARPLKANVRHSFEPEMNDEIQLRDQDIVLVRKVFDDDWCYGTNLSKGNVDGIFPLCHLQMDSIFIDNNPNF